jgi:hypothetical protein
MPRFTLRPRKTTEDTAPSLELPPPAGPPRPPLIVLLPRSGVTSFTVNTLPDGRSGRAFLQSIIQPEIGLPRGLIAFWALQNPPPEFRDAVEPVVLICNPEQPSIGCPYFFVDMTSSQAYAATKLQQGTDPSSISVYLAQLVDVHVSQEGSVSMNPAHPPYVPKSRTPGHVIAVYELGRRAEELGTPADRRHKLPKAMKESPPRV